MYIRILTTTLTAVRSALVNAYCRRADRMQRTADTLWDAARQAHLDAHAAEVEARRCAAEAAKL